MTGTFQHTWDNAVEQHADSVFLVFRSESGTRSEWIYGEFDALVARVAGRLREAGVRPGSSVHAVLPNCPASSRCGSPRRSSERGWCPPTRHPRHATSPTTSAGRSPVGVCAADRAAVYHDGANGAVPVVLELAEDASDLGQDGPLHGDPSRRRSRSHRRTASPVCTPRARRRNRRVSC